jgi:hypothetical protein
MAPLLLPRYNIRGQPVDHLAGQLHFYPQSVELMLRNHA